MLTVFLLSNGEPSYDQCRKLAMAQIWNGRKLVDIMGVTPVYRAFNQMLDTCDTDLFVQLEADMLLAPGALDHLVESIKDSAEHVGWLWGDAENRPIQGIKIYRTDLARTVRFQDCLAPDIEHADALRARGMKVTADRLPSCHRECLGDHLSLQTEEMARARGARLRRTYEAYPHRMGWVTRCADRWKMESEMYKGWTEGANT